MSKEKVSAVSRDDELRMLEEELGYLFNDQQLLARAMTHRSFANENSWARKDNQRLEFLGDAVLGLVIAEALFRLDERAPEGALSNQQSELVCEPALVRIAEKIKLGSYLRLGRGEERTGGRRKDGLLADAYEALLGAVYLDGGHEAARELILRLHERAIEEVLRTGGIAAKSPRDSKSYFQRIVQIESDAPPEYRIVEEVGPPHERLFIAEVLVGDVVLGRGEGNSKKSAEQAAAEQGIAAWEEDSGNVASE